MVPYLMRAALAVGVDAIFAEVHPDPDHAFSDGPNQLRLDQIRGILEQAVQLDDLSKSFLSDNHLPTDKLPSVEEFRPKQKDIRLFLSDVDGVQTDSGMYYFNSRDEAKRFNAHDGMGLQLLRRSGVKTGFITSEDTLLVENRFRKLKLDYLVQGSRDGGKLASALEICKKEGISLEQVAYIGDDVNCLDLLEKAGWAACPQDAVKEIKSIPGITILSKKGGDGCVREFIDLIMKS